MSAFILNVSEEHIFVVDKRRNIISEAYGCICAAEAADPALGSPVEPEEREDMDMEAVAHGLVLLVVDLQEQHVRIPLSELRNLHIGTTEFA